MATGSIVSGLYALDTTSLASGADVALVADLRRWHLRLAHVSIGGIKSMAERGVLLGVKISPNDSQQDCVGCILGKSHRAPIPRARSSRAAKLLERAHSDLLGRWRLRQSLDLNAPSRSSTTTPTGPPSTPCARSRKRWIDSNVTRRTQRLAPIRCSNHFKLMSIAILSLRDPRASEAVMMDTLPRVKATSCGMSNPRSLCLTRCEVDESRAAVDKTAEVEGESVAVVDITEDNSEAVNDSPALEPTAALVPPRPIKMRQLSTHLQSMSPTAPNPLPHLDRVAALVSPNRLVLGGLQTLVAPLMTTTWSRSCLPISRGWHTMCLNHTLKPRVPATSTFGAWHSA